MTPLGLGLPKLDFGDLVFNAKVARQTSGPGQKILTRLVDKKVFHLDLRLGWRQLVALNDKLIADHHNSLLAPFFKYNSTLSGSIENLGAPLYAQCLLLA